jgi:hypothetical protein
MIAFFETERGYQGNRKAIYPHPDKVFQRVQVQDVFWPMVAYFRQIPEFPFDRLFGFQ